MSAQELCTHQEEVVKAVQQRGNLDRVQRHRVEELAHLQVTGERVRALLVVVEDFPHLKRREQSVNRPAAHVNAGDCYVIQTVSFVS